MVQGHKAPKKFMSFVPGGPLGTLIIMPIIDLLLPLSNTSCNTYRTLVISHNKSHLPFDAKCAKLNHIYYCAVLNIKRFDIVLKCYHFKIRKSRHNIGVIMVIARSTVNVNRAQRGCASQTKQNLEKEYFYQGRAWKNRNTGKNNNKTTKNIKQI